MSAERTAERGGIVLTRSLSLLQFLLEPSLLFLGPSGRCWRQLLHVEKDVCFAHIVWLGKALFLSCFDVVLRMLGAFEHINELLL